MEPERIPISRFRSPDCVQEAVMLQTETHEHAELAEDSEASVVGATPAGTPTPSAVSRGLFFQRCLWCGTPAYRRSFCRACGATALKTGAQHRCRGPRSPYRPGSAQHVVRRDGRGLQPALPGDQDGAGRGRGRGEGTSRAGRGSPRPRASPHRTHPPGNVVGALLVTVPGSIGVTGPGRSEKEGA